MRFNEFKTLVEAPNTPTLGPAGAVPLTQPTKDKIKDGILKAGPPYPPDQKDNVSAMQADLKKLGYNIGKTGIDGKYGPRTKAAVAAFKKDYKISGDGNNFSPEDTKTLDNVTSGKIAKVPARLTQTDKLLPLSQDSLTQGKVGSILDFIARYESRGNYNVILGGETVPELTKMTLNQVHEYQRQMVQSGKESSAVGRYQYIRKTLRDTAAQMRLDPNTTIFDQKTQDAIATYTLRSIGLDRWLNGQLSDEDFLNNVAKIWAGIPNTAGISAYQGVGSNKAGTTSKNALATLQNIKTGTTIA